MSSSRMIRFGHFCFGVFIHLILVWVCEHLHAQQDASKDEFIRIGILHSRTATMQISEESLVHAALLAVEEINAKGGVLGKRLIPIVRDGESDPEVFAQQARELIEIEKVCSIFGCWTSDSRKAVISVVEPANNLLWYPVQYEGGETSKRVMYTGAAPNQQIIPAVNWCLEEMQKTAPFPKVSQMGVFLVGSDYVFPVEANRIIKAVLTERGAILVGEEYRPRGDQHFKTIVEMIKAEKPHLIFNTVNGDSNIALFEELSNTWTAGDPPPMVMSVSIAEDEIRSMGTRFRRTLASRFLTGHYCAWNYFQSLDVPQNHEFVARFRRYCEDNKLPGGNTRVTDDPIEAAYVQIHLFAKAVEKAKSTNPEAIRAAALGITLTSPSGSVQIDAENQHTWKAVRIGRLRADGQFDILLNSNNPIKPDPYPSVAFPGGEADTKRRKEESKSLESIKVLSAQNLIVLKGGLQSKYSEVRQLAARKLATFGLSAKPAIKELQDALSDEDLLVSQTALDALSTLGANSDSSLKPIVDAVGHARVGMRLRAVAHLADVAKQLREEGRTSAIPELQRALDLMKNTSYPPEQSMAIEQAMQHLKDAQIKERTQKLISSLTGSIWFWAIAVYLGALLFFGTVGIYFFPLWILDANNSLQKITEVKLFDATVPIPVRHILGIGWFHYHTRVLDAWVSQHLPAAYHNFQKYETVKRRQVYIPLPIALDGKASDDVSPDQFRMICGRKRWCVHIRGGGGTGKTALACQMALWSMSDLPSGRLMPTHRMIPILIEPGLGSDVIKDVETLTKTVLGQLTLIVASGETIPAEFCVELLRRQRLVVILDDLGAIAGPNWSLPSEPDFSCNALIVTSRSKEKLGNAHKTEAIPLRVVGKKLSSFMEAYLQKRNTRDKFTDPEFFEACNKLSTMVGNAEVYREENEEKSQQRQESDCVDSESRDSSCDFQSEGFDDETSKCPMTVLFAKIFAEQLIASKRDRVPRGLPRDIPNLMLEYIDQLNRTYGKFSDRDVQNAAKLIAWECCKASLRPQICARSGLLIVLGPNAEELIGHLQNRLIVIQATGPNHDGIRFTIDPLAEYLAGFHLINTYGSDDSSWDAFLTDVQARRGLLRDYMGFLRALRDCCLAQGHKEVPADLPERLAALIGMRLQSPDVIKVGVLHSLTGHMEMSERPLVGAAELAISEINAAGGVLGRKIQAIVEDGKSEPAEFAKKAKQLIEEEGVCSIFGCWTSASRQAVLPVVEQLNHLLWYPVQYEGFESSPNVIYTGAAPNQQIIPAVDWCLENLGKRFFLVGSEYIFPRKANEIVKACMAIRGLEPVGEEYIALGELDFASIVQMIKDTAPDVVFNTVNGDSNRGLFTDLSKAGIFASRIPVMSVSMAEVEVAEIGTRLTRGHYCAWNYFQTVDTPENKHFVEAYKRFKGEQKPTDDPIEASYFQMHLFAHALAKAGTDDPRAIREAARGLEYRAPGGCVSIDPKNLHTWKVARIGKVRDDGQFDIVWSSDAPIQPDPQLKWLFQTGVNG